MAESLDNLDMDSMANDLNELQIKDNSDDYSPNETSVFVDIIEDLKDKCELIVANDEDNEDKHSVDDISYDDHLTRDNDSDAEVESSDYIKVSIVSTEDNDCKTGGESVHSQTLLFPHPKRPNNNHRNRNPNPNTRTEKWGESVGVFNENGSVKRVVSLDELHNYLELKSSTHKLDSIFYTSLINDRFPRFFDSTVEYFQRWRMRYNIFVDKVLVDKSDPSLLHFGEVHLYFDLNPKASKPLYVNHSLYLNTSTAEKPLDLECLQKVHKVLNNICKSKDIFQLCFPIRSSLFQSTDKVFDKFLERQQELMEESTNVHRRGYKKRRFFSDKRGGPPPQSYNFRFERQFGQNSRDFHQMGREFGRNEQNFREFRRGFGAKDLNSQEKQSFSQNGRGFQRRNSNNREFTKTWRPIGDNRRYAGNAADSDVTFEDTLERYERNGNSNKGLSRLSEQTINRNRNQNEANYPHNGRQNDFENRFTRHRHSSTRREASDVMSGSGIDFQDNASFAHNRPMPYPYI